MKASILFNKIKEIDLKRMNLLADFISKENNKSKTYIKFDMFKNFLIYKIGYTDYFKGNYINLTKEQKKDYLTSKNFINVIGYLNPKPYRVVTNDKIVFNQIYRKYLKRDFIDVRTSSEEQLQQFTKGKKHVFAKPTTDFGGHNIKRIVTKDIKDYKEFKKELIKNKQYLLEDEIIQHEVLTKLNPYAVNGLRIVTLYKDGQAHVLAITLRINIDDAIAISCRDAYARINEDGTFASPIVDDDGVIYETHPLTNIKFSEIKEIPYTKEAIEMVKEAALLVPEIRYIGWDIAITENGPSVIEGNEFPSYGLVQNHMINKNPAHLKQIKDIIKDEINNIKL